MFTVSRGIPVNDASGPDQPTLTRADVWRGLVLKADNALPFVPKMTKCEVTSRAPTWLERDVVFRGEPAGERVTFFPRDEVRFERTSGATMGTIRNQIEEEGDGALVLRFTFSLEREGIPHGSEEEAEYARQMEGAYLGAVDATLSAIRQFTAGESSGSAVETAASPEIVGYLERLLDTAHAGDHDGLGRYLSPNVRLRIGGAPPVTGRAEVVDALSAFGKAAGGPDARIMDAWHVDDLIGAEVDLAVDGGAAEVPCVHLLRMDGDDLIADHRVVVDSAALRT